jgi:UDP-2-acetamido-3-amino-2,3-dideoxy-glucuronate N-acetyltransferase
MGVKKVCVIGAGRWGRNHIKTLHDMGFLGGIVEKSAKVRKEMAVQYPDKETFEDLKQALQKGFDGYVVATPAETHFAIAEEILKNKKHVLVEKPITLTAKDAVILSNLAEKNRVNLMVGHVMLFHPAIRKIKELIENGKIGKLEYIYSNRLNLGTVRKEENILWSFAPHDISIFQHLIGKRPIEVVSRGGAFIQPHIHDSTMTVLTYPDNLVGHIFVSWLHPFKEHRLVVIGSKGMLSFEDSAEKILYFYEKGIDWVKGEPVKREGPTETIPFGSDMPLSEELAYFTGHLDGSPIEIANAQNAVDVLSILECATQSLMGGSAVHPKADIQDSKPYYIHPTALVDDPVEIGEGTKIWHFSHVQSGSVIGAGCSLGQNVNVGNNVRIGKKVKIQNNVSIYEGVELEDYVFCGPSMVFTNIKQPRSEFPQRGAEFYFKTRVKKSASLGANCTIVCGTTIGQYAFVGAGSVVTKDVPDFALVVGNPAKFLSWVCKCGHKLDFNEREEVKCRKCGREYRLEQGNVKVTKDVESK